MTLEPNTSLIHYPCEFPIKVLGVNADGFVPAMILTAQQFDSNFDANNIELRESTGGKYVGVTLTITASSREQLDELYRTLSSHPMVKVVL